MKSLIKSETRIQRALTPEQILFAQWLSLPSQQRSPHLQQEFAELLGVSEQTLCTWKKDVRIIELKREFIDAEGDELVPDAIATLKRQLNSDNERVANQAARDILDRWGQMRRSGKVTSIVDFYEYIDKKHNEE